MLHDRHLQFRASFYNVLNRANFRALHEIVYAAAGSPISATGGLITATSTPSRQIQIAARLVF